MDGVRLFADDLKITRADLLGEIVADDSLAQ